MSGTGDAPAAQIDWARAALAGVVGTIVMDVIGLIVLGHWTTPAMLGQKLGVGLAGGAVAHYLNGILLAIIYAGLAPSLWGPRWVRALTYITAQTVFGVWLFLMPLLGMGIAGLGSGSVATPLVSLIRHWGYGLALAWLYPLPTFSRGRSRTSSGATPLAPRPAR